MQNLFKDKTVMVIGASGTIGRGLVQNLINRHKDKPSKLICIDNNESELFFLEQEFRYDNRVACYILDITDANSVNSMMRGVDIVFHAAALKHVILSEKSPRQALNTNIQGTINIIEAAVNNEVQRVVFTSSDKAVNPTNVMGATKLLGERLITAAHFNCDKTIFHSTRFGNVLGSSGSVFLIFKKQIKSGGPVTLTSKEMSRFVMGIEDSVNLVVESCRYAEGGEIFITKMPSIRISDLAAVMIEELSESAKDGKESITIEEIGIKPGEKLYEELMSSEETRRSFEMENFFVVLPALRDFFNQKNYSYLEGCKKVEKPYLSSEEDFLCAEDIKTLLRDCRLI